MQRLCQRENAALGQQRQQAQEDLAGDQRIAESRMAADDAHADALGNLVEVVVVEAGVV